MSMFKPRAAVFRETEGEDTPGLGLQILILFRRVIFYCEGLYFRADENLMRFQVLECWKGHLRTAVDKSAKTPEFIIALIIHHGTSSN